MSGICPAKARIVVGILSALILAAVAAGTPAYACKVHQVVIQLHGTLVRGTFTNGQILITSGFVVVNGIKFKVSPNVNNYVYTDSSMGQLSCWGISLGGDIVMGIAALYTVHSRSVLDVQFGGGGPPFPGTTAIVSSSLGVLYAINGKGHLKVQCGNRIHIAVHGFTV
jgi:hypothetical protein